MRYVLGIDIGGTRIKAAVCRRAGEFWSEPEVVCALESVLHVAPDATVIAGPDARRRALAEPERIARGFARQVGDDVPLMLGDELYRPESLTAVVAGWVADQVAESEGGEADRIALTHPPGWTGFRRSLLHDALHEAGMPGALLLPNTVAAAESMVVRERVETGSRLAVCRLGGEHVDIALLRRGPATFELLAHDEQFAPRLDDVLAEHVAARFGGEPAELREVCTQTKELLSTAREVDVPGRVTRTEFERLVEPWLTVSLAPLSRFEDVSTLLLAGGAARIPLVARLAGEALDCRVVLDPDPATAACRGAALAARPPAPAPRESTALVPRVTGYPDLDPDEVYDPEPAPQRPPVVLTPLEPPRRRFVPSRRSRNEDDE
ncbi:Hsp70 family protein [Amycolatopsis alkalitolerans]|uniref:Hsp70 family protein n=1 Tax=Amycolatopsis alkalitolerans TaxID=2547244 RepID=A0A5C4LRU5_9PSEU|nr:Hsp70 family protein [Amycolatopsis alkalitolerans]TNC20866.1 Hsp70 family protein [Amycolatopsis alkalitolerans]